MQLRIYYTLNNLVFSLFKQSKDHVVQIPFLSLCLCLRLCECFACFVSVCSSPDELPSSSDPDSDSLPSGTSSCSLSDVATDFFLNSLALCSVVVVDGDGAGGTESFVSLSFTESPVNICSNESHSAWRREAFSSAI